RRWARNGQIVKRLLVEDLDLQPTDRVLEVGCGGGRNALALSDYLESGGYVGLDIDPVSIAACRAQPALSTFEFVVADVENDLYYPEIPTKVVGYELGTFERWFRGGEVRGLLGQWRRDGNAQIRQWQDWVVVRVPA